jgi:hypothetical protein
MEHSTDYVSEYVHAIQVPMLAFIERFFALPFYTHHNLNHADQIFASWMGLSRLLGFLVEIVPVPLVLL